ncbi:plasmid mobilization protein [Niabella beijingensis]|nr:plasmid mobilization relaxosome protein MobC [Niabella beijingensis]MBZ4187673.1 plasmid mobilization relaxosome protein MobC [Niabella beijingensis]
MNEEKPTPKRWVTIRVKPEEYRAIHKLYEQTTCTKLSQYVRKVLLQKPVIILYKDEASREILSVLNQLSRELSAIGNNFNQTVHKLHTLDHIPEIKIWAELTESGRQNLLKKIEEIRISMNQIRQQCVLK